VVVVVIVQPRSWCSESTLVEKDCGWTSYIKRKE
jgi:hypothetical protein